MPTVFEQLQAAQGTPLPEVIDDDGLEGDFEIAAPAIAVPFRLLNIAPVPQHHTSMTVTVSGPGGGYIKIFPPTMTTLRDLTPEWVAANWEKPSPWCRVEGLPDHPEFEANLAGVER